jgi:multidrug efflux system outer membrane protein
LSTDFASLTTGGTSTYAFAPIIRWPIFDLGHVQARIDASDALAQQKLAMFQKTVLGALEDIDTAMVRFSREEERRARLSTAARANAKAAGLADERYRAGLDSFLDLLDAQQRQFESEDRLAQSEVQNALYLVAVYKALGGGWDLGEKAAEKP